MTDQSLLRSVCEIALIAASGRRPATLEVVNSTTRLITDLCMRRYEIIAMGHDIEHAFGITLTEADQRALDDSRATVGDVLGVVQRHLDEKAGEA